MKKYSTLRSCIIETAKDMRECGLLDESTYEKIVKKERVYMRDMQFFRERPKERVYVWVSGKNQETRIYIRHFDSSSYMYSENGTIEMKINQAKELYEFLGEAIEKAEKKTLEENNDEDD